MAVNLVDSYKEILWDLNTKGLNTSYWGKKTDNGRGLKVKLLQNAVEVTPTTELLRIYCINANGNKIYINATIVGNYFQIDLTNQVYEKAGLTTAELQLNVGSEWITSETFYIEVADNLVDSSILSSDDFIALQDALAKCNNLETNYAPRLTQAETNIGQLNTNLDAKVNKDEVTNGLTAKDGVKTWAQLQAMTTGNAVGDYYYCSDGDGTNPAGNYRWTGSAFSFGGTGDDGYNKLKNDLAQLPIEIGATDLSEHDIAYTINSVYTYGGIAKSYLGWFSSDKVEIPDGHNVIYIKAPCIATSDNIKVNAVSFFDASGNYICGFHKYDNIAIKAQYSLFNKAFKIPLGSKYFAVSKFNNGVIESENKVISYNYEFMDTDNEIIDDSLADVTTYDYTELIYTEYFINRNGEEISNGLWRSSEFVDVGYKLTFQENLSVTVNSLVSNIAFYDSDKNYIGNWFAIGDDNAHIHFAVGDIVVPNGTKYFRYVYTTANTDSAKFNIYKKNISDKINETINLGVASNYYIKNAKLKHKVPIVAFIFDDCLPVRDDMGGIENCKWLIDYFNKKSLKFSVCLSDNIVEQNLDLTPYVKYQSQGHEILSHSKDHWDYTNMTSEEIKTAITRTFKWLDEYGISRRGFVYPNNLANDTTDAIIRKYYDYSFVGSTGTSRYATMTEANSHRLSRLGAIEEMTKSNIISNIDTAISNNELIVLWGHGYRIGNSAWSACTLSKDDMKEILDYISDRVNSYELLSLGINTALDYIS